MPGHQNGQVRQNPVRAVFTQNPDAAAFGPTLGLDPAGHAAHLVCRLTPGDVLHLTGPRDAGQGRWLLELARLPREGSAADAPAVVIVSRAIL